MITYRKISKDNRMYISTERTQLMDGYMMIQIDLLHNRLFPKILSVSRNPWCLAFIFSSVILKSFFLIGNNKAIIHVIWYGGEMPFMIERMLMM